MHLGRRHFHWAIVMGAFVAACSSSVPGSSSTTTGGPAAQRSACSTGPAYAFDTPFAAANENFDPSLPECTPRCENGDARAENGHVPGAWSIAALPSGACTVDGETCIMAAMRTLTCPSGRKTSCSYTGYRCACEGGAWRCVSGAQGASACTCAADAGAP